MHNSTFLSRHTYVKFKLQSVDPINLDFEHLAAQIIQNEQRLTNCSIKVFCKGVRFIKVFEWSSL